MEDKRIGSLFKQVHDSIEKRANNSLRATGLTMMQLGVLMALGSAEGGELPMKELEKRFGVSQPTMFGITSRLRQKGLVELLTAPNDRRMRLAHVTPAGLSCLHDAETHIWETENLLLKGFSPDETELCRSFLIRILNNLK